MIICEVNKNHLNVRTKELLTAGSQNVNTVEFRFNAAWDGLTKTATFKTSKKTISVLLGTNTTEIPWEVLADAGEILAVGVFGVSGETIVLPTVWGILGKVMDAAHLGDEEKEPTPDVYQKILDELNSLENPTWNAVQNKPFESLGDGLAVDENGVLSAKGGTGGSPNAVQYVAQSLTDEQKAQARENIGAGTSSFSGSYNDLTNKPTIPTQVTIDSTLKQSGQAADAKAVGDALAEVDIKLGEKQPKGNYLTAESDPTVPAWAKSPTKPTYTAEEVGALPDTTVIPPAYTLPQATSDALGGIKADAATAEDTQDVRIGADGKLRTKPTGGSSVTVDSELSSTSENPVQNKVVTAALAEKITAPTTAAVGQIIKVKSVDDAGTPTEWEAADLGEDEYIVLVNTTFAENKLNTDMWLDETLYAATHVWRSATPLDLICMCIYVPAQTENIITSGELKVGVLSDDKDSNYWDLPPEAPYFGFASFVYTNGQNRWRKFIFDLRTRTAEVEVGNNLTRNAAVSTSIACMPQFGKYYAQSAYLQAISIRLIEGSLPAGTELFVYGRKNNGNRIKHPGWSIT